MSAKFNYEWPFNLIYDIFQDDELCKNPPKDINHAIKYALFLLEDEYGSLCTEIIRMRYFNKLTYERIANKVHRAPETIRKSLIRSIRSLRHPTLSGYIKYGIEGFLKHRVDQAAKNARVQGYHVELTTPRDNKNDTDEMKIATNQSVDILKIRTRARNCLRRAKIQTIQDLLNFDPKNLIRIRNMGTSSYIEIISALESYGFNCDHMKIN